MIEKAMLITEKNECVCLFMTKAHTYFTRYKDIPRKQGFHI